MRRIEAENQPVEEAPALRCAFLKQSIHRWRQPQHRPVLGQGRLRGILAIKAHDTALSRTFDHMGGTNLDRTPPGRSPGPAADAFTANCNRCRNRPGMPLDPVTGTAFPPVHVTQPAPAQATARAQHRHRFQQVGLARAIGAAEDHRKRVELKLQAAITAKVGKDQAGYCRQGHAVTLCKPVVRFIPARFA